MSELNVIEKLNNFSFRILINSKLNEIIINIENWIAFWRQIITGYKKDIFNNTKCKKLLLLTDIKFSNLRASRFFLNSSTIIICETCNDMGNQSKICTCQ